MKDRNKNAKDWMKASHDKGRNVQDHEDMSKKLKIWKKNIQDMKQWLIKEKKKAKKGCYGKVPFYISFKGYAKPFTVNM